jgi:hypothetical protein
MANTPVSKHLVFQPVAALATTIGRPRRLAHRIAAYWLMLTVRDAIPKAHALATAEFNTIRLRLLKLGARVVEMASRVRLAFAAACPEAALIRHIAAALMPTEP